MKRLCCILILIFSVFAVESFSKEWNGIIPGVSTRRDVEKRLVRISFMKLETNIYKYKKSSVHIDYERKDAKDFDKDVVKEITVYPDKIETLAKYIKKIPNFHKDFVKTEVPNKISHINGVAYYRNPAEGFEIRVQKINEVVVIHAFDYFAPELPSTSPSVISPENQSRPNLSRWFTLSSRSRLQNRTYANITKKPLFKLDAKIQH